MLPVQIKTQHTNSQIVVLNTHQEKSIQEIIEEKQKKINEIMTGFKQKLAKFDQAIHEVERENMFEGHLSNVQDTSLVDLFIETINKSATLLLGNSSF